MEIQILPDEIIRAFSELDTPSVSDAMDRLGVPCALPGIKPVSPGVKLCGQAFTCLLYTSTRSSTVPWSGLKRSFPW